MHRMINNNGVDINVGQKLHEKYLSCHTVLRAVHVLGYSYVCSYRRLGTSSVQDIAK